MSKLITQQTRTAKDSAFSLFELVIVISIVGTMAAIAIPRYQNSLTRYRAERAAYRITADIRAARIQARTSSSGRYLKFTTDPSGYYIAQNEDQIISGGIDPILLSESPYHIQFDSVDFGGDQVLILNGYGVPDSGGTIVLHSGDVQKTVVIEAESAKASIQ